MGRVPLVLLTAAAAGAAGWALGRTLGAERAGVAPPAPPAPVAAEPVPPEDSHEAEDYREELQRTERELGLLEARALAAWDRTVPHLEESIAELTEENQALRREVQVVRERLAAEVRAAEQLRVIIGERDQRIAEIRRSP